MKCEIRNITLENCGQALILFETNRCFMSDRKSQKKRPTNHCTSAKSTNQLRKVKGLQISGETTRPRLRACNMNPRVANYGPVFTREHQMV